MNPLALFERRTIIAVAFFLIVVVTLLLYAVFGDPPPLEINSKTLQYKNESKNNAASKQTIFCMVFTTPNEWNRKALAVRLTWIQRCDYYKFFYSKQDGIDLKPGAYALDVPDGRDHLTAKSMLGLRLSYETYKEKVDWFLKCDDDTYFIMENLRHLLSKYNPAELHYLGHSSNDFLKHGYNSGGAGYVLSRAAAQLVVEQGDRFPKACPVDGGTEDLDMGTCLAAFRVYPKDTHDSEGRIRFHCDHPIKLLLGDENAQQVYQYSKDIYAFGHHEGIKVMSDETISFHYMEPGYMYMYDFLLYDLKRF